MPRHQDVVVWCC